MNFVTKQQMQDLVNNIRNNLNNNNLIQYQNELRLLVGNELYKVVYPSVLSTIKLRETNKNMERK